jgi:uncharacterized membrane protein
MSELTAHVSGAGTRLLRIGVIVVATVGLTAAVARGFGVAITMQSDSNRVLDTSPFDEWSVRALGLLLRVSRDSQTYADAAGEDRLLTRKYNTHPVTTLLHVVPAALFMVLAPLQFSRRIRSRHITWHRLGGRVLIVAAIPLVASGFYFGLAMPFAGFAEASAIVLFGALFVLSIARGVMAIRNGNRIVHGVWMTRMFGVAIGVALQRVVGIVSAVLTQRPPHAWFALSIWLGFLIGTASAEMVIRSRRANLPAVAVAISG